MVTGVGMVLERLTVEKGFALMVTFYRERRADDCPAQLAEADMLSFSWMTAYGRLFEVEVIRQFALGDSDEDIWRLSLTFTFTVSGEMASLAPGFEMCLGPQPDTVNKFERLIMGLASYRAVAKLRPLRVNLHYYGGADAAR
jgi:hypothetical protein